MKSDHPTLYLAIDPAIAKPCWIAERGGIFPCWITEIEPAIERAMDAWIDEPHKRIVALIEKPSVGKRSYGLAMIFAANAIAEAIRRIAPNPKGSIKNTWRNKIYFVDPRVWQRAMLKGAPGADTKEQSCFVASEITGREITDHNKADAVCLYAYAESLNWKLK